MGTVAALQCHSGVSGDMLLGALVDLGFEPRLLESLLLKLPLPAVRLQVRHVERGGLRACNVSPVFSEGGKRFSTLGHVKEALRGSALPGWLVKEAEKVFTRLAEAEAEAHGRQPGTVHFHELGSPDTLVDIVGVLLGWRELGISEAFSSSVNLGGGTVQTEHGSFPVPAPATARLLRGWPVFSDGEEGEKTTPTGAALLSHLCRPMQGFPSLSLRDSGYGAGERDYPSRPNCLQVLLGVRDRDVEGEEAVLMETNLDDLNPQVFGFLTEKLLKEGAMEAFVTPVVMKKGRPGHLLTVVSPVERAEPLGKVLFRETATLGYRTQRIGRVRLRREVREVRTGLGPVRVKVAFLDGERIRYAPEYEDCRRLAKLSGRPLREIVEEVTRTSGADRSGEGG